MVWYKVLFRSVAQGIHTFVMYTEFCPLCSPQAWKMHSHNVFLCFITDTAVSITRTLEYTCPFAAWLKENYIVSCLKTSFGNCVFLLSYWNWQAGCVGRGSRVASVRSGWVPDWMWDTWVVGSSHSTWNATCPCLELPAIWNSQKNSCNWSQFMAQNCCRDAVLNKSRVLF